MATERSPAAGWEALGPLHRTPGKGGHLGSWWRRGVGRGASGQTLLAHSGGALARGKLLREAVVCHPWGTAGRLRRAPAVGCRIIAWGWRGGVGWCWGGGIGGSRGRGVRRGRGRGVGRGRGGRVGGWTVIGPRGWAVGRRRHCKPKISKEKCVRNSFLPAPLTPSQRTVQDNFNIRAAQFLFLQRCVPSFFMALI